MPTCAPICAANLTGMDAASMLTVLPDESGTTAISLLLFGFTLGLKHALEADHVAAVSTIVGERRSLLGSTLVGGLWGVGHTLSLLVVGVMVLLLRFQIDKRTELALEFGVGLMLVALGADALRKLTHQFADGRAEDVRFDGGSPARLPRGHSHLGFGKRPLLIGMAHGLAGSAALMLGVLSTISALPLALIYISVFGVGSIGGMMLMSTALGLPLGLTSRNFVSVNAALRLLAGLFSVGVGLFMIYEIGFVEKLFG